METADVSTAYLNADLDTPVWMRPPKGVKDPEGKGRIIKLHKSLYGLKVSAKNWHRTFVKKIKAFADTSVDIQFNVVTSDECFFHFKQGTSILMVLIVVDDILTSTNDRTFRLAFITFLPTEFIVTDDGELRYFLGVGYDRLLDGSVIATQTGFIDHFLERFNMTNVKGKRVPMESNFAPDLSDVDENADPEIVAWYQAVVGCILYVVIWTRPDCAYSTNVLTRYMSKPGPRLVKAARGDLLNLKHTRRLGIRFTRHDPKGHGHNVLSTYVDSSDADCKITRQSTGGFVMFFNSGPAAFRAALQRLTTLSSCESELVQLSIAVQEIRHVRELLEYLGFKQTQPTVIFEDNQATIRIAESPGSSHNKTKHIGRRYSFVSEGIKEGEAVMVYIPSEKNNADIFTKPLAHDKFIILRSLLLNLTDTPHLHEDDFDLTCLKEGARAQRLA